MKTKRLPTCTRPRRKPTAKQARILNAMTHPMTRDQIAARSNMLLPSTGYYGAEFRKVFNTCIGMGWVYVAQPGDGCLREPVYYLTNAGLEKLAELEAGQ